MHGYVLQKTTGLPKTEWACYAAMRDYDWRAKDENNLLEFSICEADTRMLSIGNAPPAAIHGTTVSCIIGGTDLHSFADAETEVTVLSVTVRFSELHATLKEFDTADLENGDVLLLPLNCTLFTEQELAEMKRLCHRFIHHYVKGDAASETLCNSIIFELLYRMDALARRQTITAKKKQINYYVTKVSAIIAQRYAQKLSLDTVAHELGITPNYLSSIFKKAMGVGFAQALLNVRLQKAKELLLNTSLSVFEIAEKAGFGNDSTLRKRFKEHFGTCMREYRCIANEQTLYHDKPTRNKS